MNELRGGLQGKILEFQTQSDGLKSQIEELKYARDRYRQQMLDQKQEVRKLKAQLSSQAARQSIGQAMTDDCAELS